MYYIFTVCYISNNISNTTFPEYVKYENKSFSKIPNVIYTYWHSGEHPTLVKKCIQSWRRHNPSYKIVIISKENIKDYIPFDIDTLRFANTQQQKSDFIRCYILAANGGIWLDASLYLNQSLDWIHSYQHAENSEFVGYKLNGFTYLDNSPVIENWFMACIPNSTFMKDWTNTFYSMNRYETIKDYVESLKRKTDFQKIDDPYYLTMHIACQYVLQNKNSYKLSLLEAEKGPFLYLNKMYENRFNPLRYWNHIYFIPLMMIHKSKESPVVKYRQGERMIIEKLYLTKFLE